MLLWHVSNFLCVSVYIDWNSTPHPKKKFSSGFPLNQSLSDIFFIQNGEKRGRGA